MELLLIDWAPAVAAILCVAAFLLACAVQSRSIVDNLIGFVGYVVLFGLLGLVIVVAIVFALTAIYESPQGPFLLIDYVPIGVAIGEVVGAIMWSVKKAKGTKAE
jgi:hypothetical protein